MSNELAIARQETLQLLQDPDRINELAKCLPKGWDAQAFMRVVMTTHTASPWLYETTLTSRWLGIMQAAALGLPIDGKLACYMRFGKVAQLEVMYRGYIQLAYRHPRVKEIHPALVLEGDEWTYEEGLTPRVVHRPARRMAAPKDEEIIAGYASCLVTGGGKPFVWLWKYDMDEHHRDKSSAYKSGKSPWITDPLPMYLKTTIKVLAKYIPQSTELVQAIALEQENQEQAAPYLHVPATASVEAVLDAIAGEEQPLP